LSKVYVINAAGHSYDAAKEFTNEPLIPLTEGRINIFDVSLLTVEFAEKLQHFTSDDYLMLTGSPVLSAIALSVLKETYAHGEVNVLLFHAGMNKYIPRRIDGYVEKYSVDDGIID